MGFVYHEEAIEALGQVEQIGQRGEIAVHAEYRVGDNQPASRMMAVVLQQLFQMVDIGMPVNVHGGTGQATTVDQAGMVKGVAEYYVLGAGQRTDHRQIGDKAATKNQRGFDSLPLS